jgi:tRNA nucleotidyltransferase/poly(A) polymerase
MQLPIATNIFPEKTGVYIVGGSIRDLLSGRKPFDYDLAVDHDADLFARRLADKTSGHVVELGKHGFKMIRVVTRDHFFDVTPINGDDIISDLRNRDFTINAMAIEVSSGDLIDPLGGQKDLKAATVRMVSREVFRRDPLRLIRAYRMASVFDFNIEADTRTAISADADLIRKTAGERIRDELFKILQDPGSHAYLSQMAQSGLLFHVFPEFLGLEQRRQRPDDRRTVFERTLDAYVQLEMLLNPAGEFRRSAGRFFKDADGTRAVLLKWSLLFHDIALAAASPAPAEDPQSNHSAVADNSAAMALKIARRLKFSRRQADAIGFIVQHHCRPYALFQDHLNDGDLAKHFIRLFLLCRGMTPDVLVHALAEYAGKYPSNRTKIRQFEKFIHRLIEQYYTVLRPRASQPPPISGQDLIDEFGMKPSKEFRHILTRVEEERLAHASYSREEALKLVENLLSRKRGQ